MKDLLEKLEKEKGSGNQSNTKDIEAIIANLKDGSYDNEHKWQLVRDLRAAGLSKFVQPVIEKIVLGKEEVK